MNKSPTPARRICSTVAGDGRLEGFFQWRIEHFQLVSSHDDLLNSESFQFGIGSESEPTTTSEWKVGLTCYKDGEESWIGLCFTLTKKSSELTSPPRFQIGIPSADESGKTIIVDSEQVSPEVDSVNSTWRFNKIMNRAEIPKLIDDYLRMEVGVIHNLVASSVSAPNHDLYADSRQRQLFSDLLPDWANNEANILTYPDDVFVCKKGEKGKGRLASKAILSARSAEFATLFRDNPDKKVFELEEVTRPVCHALLKYVYTGELDFDGVSTGDEIVLMARAAQKYGFPELHSYCDQVLGGMCTLANASRLLQNSINPGLCFATNQIKEYIKEHSGGIKVNYKYYTNNCFPNNYTRAEIITTGMRKEVFNFTWKISNFNVAWKHKIVPEVVTEGGRFEFDPEARWKLSLSYGHSANSKRAGIWIKYSLATELPRDFKSIYSRLQLCTRKGTSASWTDGRVSHFAGNSHDLSESGEVFLCYMEADVELPLLSNDLILDMQFKVYSKIVDGTRKYSGSVQRQFKVEAREKLWKDLGSLSTAPKSTFSDVTIVSNEGHEFYAHWSILAARCSVFEGMFRTNLKERLNGLIKLEDISSSVLFLLLCYLYKGELKDISDSKEIAQVITAADKYGLAEMLDYFDQTLASHCDLTNAIELLEMSRMFRLVNAKAMILEFVRKNV